MSDFQVNSDSGTLPVVAQNSVSPVYINGITLSELKDLLANTTPMTAARGGDSEIEFWASISRSATEQGVDILEITLDSPRLINEISFEVSRFPHVCSIFYQADASSADTFMESAKPLLNSNNARCTAKVTDSLPAVIPPLPKGYIGHPQHFGAGHWVKRSWSTTPTTLQKLWVVMQRTNNSNVPVGPSKSAIPYSLGIRNLKFGSALTSKSDVPYTERDQASITARTPFSSTTTLSGDAVTLAVRENRASNLLLDNSGVWQCEPQPLSSAIVNFYVDCRDPEGLPQTIDGFYLEPLTSGPTLNLYYSLQNPEAKADATSPDDPIVYPALQPHGGYSINKYGIVTGPGIGYLDIDNQASQWDPAKSWWMGLTFTPLFDTATDNSTYTLLDTGDISLVWRGDQNTLIFTYGSDQIVDAELSWDAFTRISVTVGFSADNGMIYLFSEDRLLVSNIVSGTLDRPSYPDLTGMSGPAIRIGGSLDTNPGGSNMRLEGLILKPEEPPLESDSVNVDGDGEETVSIETSSEWSDYLNDPLLYIQGDPGESDDTSKNAIMRFCPAFISGTEASGSNPYGFVGGSPNNFENLVWTPVASDYRLSKGYLRFRPTQAAAFKFEFTNLTAMPYDDYRPALREVKVWPDALTSSTTPTSAASPSGISSSTSQTTTTDSRTGTLGDSRITSSASSVVTTFSDQALLYINNTSLVPSPSYQPTTAVYSTDPVIAAKLRSTGIVYNNLQTWQASSSSASRFTQSLQHYYETVTVSHTQRVAFFVGLNKIWMYRADFTTAHDTAQYIEPFYDMLHIDNGHKDVGGVITTQTVFGDLSDDETAPTSIAEIGVPYIVQSFGVDPVSQDIYASQPYQPYNGDLLLHHCDPNGVVQQTMRLTGGGHGNTIAVENDNGDIYLWLMFGTTETAAVTASSFPCRVKWTAGTFSASDTSVVQPVTDFNTSGTTALRSLSFGIDQANDMIVTRTTWNGSDDIYELRKLSEYKTGSGSVLKKTTFNKAALGLGAFQGVATDGDTWIYHARGGTGDVGDTPAQLYRVAWGTTGDSGIALDSYELPIRDKIASSTDHNESEGVCVLHDADDPTITRVLFNVVTGPSGKRTNTVYEWRDQSITTVMPATPANLVMRAPANGWSLRDGGGLLAPNETESGVPLPCTSVSYRSLHRITGIQFATQQSSPKQLISDPNFYDSSLTDWQPVGDAQLSSQSESITGLEGNLAVVQRNSSISLWTTIQQTFPTWTAIERAQATWDMVCYNQNAPSPIGGLASPLLNSSVNRGRMYAAARVYSTTALSQPLTLEIVNEKGQIVASADQTIQAGQINEWYCSFELIPLESPGEVWDEVEAVGTWNQVMNEGLWSDVSQSISDGTSNYRARVVQRSSTDESWGIDNISLFVDPILWEFSIDKGNTWLPGYDVRNNPDGVLTFPEPDSYEYGKTLQWRLSSSTPNAEVHALAIRPWYDVAPKGIPVVDTVQASVGPNMTPQDLYPSIWQDPRWQTMKTPIPVEWWYSFKIWLAGQGISLTQQRIDAVVLPQSISAVNETPESE